MVDGVIRVLDGALHGLQGAASNDGDIVAGELLTREVLPQLQLHQIEQFRVVHHVHFVEVDDDAGHLHLASEENVLFGLGHGAVRCGHH